MKIEDLEKLIKVIDKSGLTEFVWQNEEEKITLKKGVPHQVIQSLEVSQSPMMPLSAPSLPKNFLNSPLNFPPKEEPVKKVEKEEVKKVEKSGHKVLSPMVGRFYKAPSPTAEPFVKVGDIVKKGQVLCIVEAMKLMNEIESDVAGKIIEACVENEEPVEFNQTLYIIEPA